MVILSSEYRKESIGELNGEDAVGIVVEAGGEWADGLSLESEITAYELDGASYGRLNGSFSVSRIGDEWVLFVEDFTATDTSDSSARVGVWLATAGGTLIGYEADPGAPTASYLPTWPSGATSLSILPIVALPSTAGTDADDVLTVVTPGDDPVWAAPTGGGGAPSPTQPIIDLSGDTGPSITADLSGVATSAASVLVAINAAVTDVELTMPTASGRGPLAVGINYASGSGTFDVTTASGALTITTGAAIAFINMVPFGGSQWAPTGVFTL